jgi:predicted alpha/beta superfamily hydrolase
MRIVIFLLFSLSTSRLCFSQPTASHQVIEVNKIHSSITGIDYDLLISGTKDQPNLPVLYVLDPDYYFLQFILSYDSLLQQGKVREALIVGIGYGQNFLKREYGVLKDLTPTKMDSKEYNENIAVIPKDSALLYTGGANAFAVFIKEKVFPFIEERFQAGDQRVVFGNGYAGLFLCDLLGKDPTLFTGYIISNPSLWWNDGTVIDSNGTSIPEDSRIFFSWGAKQEKKITTGILNFLASIKTKPGKLISSSYAGEDGLTSIPSAFKEGCKTILKKD